MYNLIILGTASRASLKGFSLVELKRFGEYSSEQFFNAGTTEVTNEVLQKTCEFPVILATEQSDGVAYLAELESATLGPDRVYFDLKWRNSFSYDLLHKYQAELGIQDFEFSRNHWAIKNIDLNMIPDFKLALSAGTSGFSNSVDAQPQTIQVVSACILANSACRDRYALLEAQTPNDPNKLAAHNLELQCLDSLMYALDAFLELNHQSEPNLEEQGKQLANCVLECLTKLATTKNGEKIANSAIGAILLGISAAFESHVQTGISAPLLFSGVFGDKIVRALKQNNE